MQIGHENKNKLSKFKGITCSFSGEPAQINICLTWEALKAKTQQGDQTPPPPLRYCHDSKF